MLTQEELAKIEEIRSHYPTGLAAVMGVLHLYQDKYGHISLDSEHEIAALLGIPVESVHGVVTFYEMYQEHKHGEHVLWVCTNVSCLLCGSDMVLDTLKQRLGIGLGETTPDGLFTIHEAECLGSCGTAPVMSINKQYRENLTPEKINAVIDELAAGDRLQVSG
jgi:NADH-quinone oxidoreductase E subunit